MQNQCKDSARPQMTSPFSSFSSSRFFFSLTEHISDQLMQHQHLKHGWISHWDRSVNVRVWLLCEFQQACELQVTNLQIVSCESGTPTFCQLASSQTGIFWLALGFLTHRLANPTHIRAFPLSRDMLFKILFDQSLSQSSSCTVRFCASARSTCLIYVELTHWACCRPGGWQ